MSSHPRRAISRDEELGKRNDDFQPRTTSRLDIAHAWRWRKRWRIPAVLVGIVVLFLLIQNLAIGGETLNAEEDLYRPGLVFHSASERQEPTGAPPRAPPGEAEQADPHYYDGKVRFFKLAASLHGIARTMGRREENRNVLFAVSSLKSAANLIPLVCEMGKWERNYVHLAFLGRDPLPLEEVLEINGVNGSECNFFLHDGRGDYSSFSTERRAGVAVAGAMKHIKDFMNPQVVITDDERVEDEFFTRTMRKQVRVMNTPLIEIPAGQYEDFQWMTKLDSGSLANWHQPTVDILIHAHSLGSGGLLRAVNSLLKADFTGLKPPRLTIELPPELDTFLERYLQSIQWPPLDSSASVKANMLFLRHRIPSSQVKPEEASLRFLESFYPTSTRDNHVLILSSQTEVTENFYHYLYYNILEYRYSAWGPYDSEDLLGISLDSPAALVDGKTALDPPTLSSMTSKRYTGDASLDKTTPVPFLYGAPSSAASLVFGDKWVVFHNFLRRRIVAHSVSTSQKATKLVTEAEPSWMEYMLELMRAKGWFMLHPASAFVTVHNDLAKVPEEYMRPKKPTASQDDTPNSAEDSSTTDDPFLAAPEPPTFPPHFEPERQTGLYSPLHETLPFKGDLPELENLPFVDYRGMKSAMQAPQLTRMSYASSFRKSVGGCSEADADRPRVVSALSADELFCLPGMDLKFGDESVGEDEEIAEAIVEDEELEGVEPDADADTDAQSEQA